MVLYYLNRIGNYIMIHDMSSGSVKSNDFNQEARGYKPKLLYTSCERQPN